MVRSYSSSPFHTHHGQEQQDQIADCDREPVSPGHRVNDDLQGWLPKAVPPGAAGSERAASAAAPSIPPGGLWRGHAACSRPTFRLSKPAPLRPRKYDQRNRRVRCRRQLRPTCRSFGKPLRENTRNCACNQNYHKHPTRDWPGDSTLQPRPKRRQETPEYRVRPVSEVHPTQHENTTGCGEHRGCGFNRLTRAWGLQTPWQMAEPLRPSRAPQLASPSLASIGVRVSD